MNSDSLLSSSRVTLLLPEHNLSPDSHIHRAAPATFLCPGTYLLTVIDWPSVQGV